MTKKKTQTALVIKPRSGISLFQSKVNSEEWKNFDTQLAGTALLQSNAWNTPVLLNNIAQTALPNGRIGRRVLMRSFNYRFTMGEVDGVLTYNPGSNVRIVIVYDRQANGAAPPSNSDPFQADTFVSPLSLANSDRYLILSDQVYSSPDIGICAQGKHGRKMSLETVFNVNGAGTIADIVSGSLWAFIATNNTILGPPTIQFYHRVRFTDA